PRREQLLVRRIPAPEVVARYVRAADPAVELEELDPVRVAVEHPLPLAREAQADTTEELRVAERRRRGQRVAVRRLDEARGSAPERCEDPEEPCVAEEGHALEPLRGRECRRWRRRACRDRLKCTA